MNPEDVLKNKGIKYQYSGADLLIKCLNPAHDDSHPSMRIDKLTGVYNCFSCGYKGSLFKKFNIPINLLDIKVQKLKEKLGSLIPMKLYLPLNRTPFEREYRGISAETYKKFQAFTLDIEPEYEGRVVFPIFNINGDIKYFTARYINSNISPKYVYRPRGIKTELYPANPPIINEAVFLVEGLFDMLNLYDKGLTNVVCNFGLSCNAARIAQLKLQGVTKLLIMFDGDTPGQEGADRVENELKDIIMIEKIKLADGTDPGSLNKTDIDSIKEYYNGKSSNS